MLLCHTIHVNMYIGHTFFCPIILPQGYTFFLFLQWDEQLRYLGILMQNTLFLQRIQRFNNSFVICQSLIQVFRCCCIILSCKACTVFLFIELSGLYYLRFIITDVSQITIESHPTGRKETDQTNHFNGYSHPSFFIQWIRIDFIQKFKCLIRTAIMSRFEKMRQENQGI